jgi:hypothetical protein
MKKTLPLTLMISASWKSRLFAAFADVLTFSDFRRGSELITYAQSTNSRTIIEMVEQEDGLVRASILLALPQPNDLEILKLGCWTLLYLKSLFPNWSDLESWVKHAAEWATETGDPVEKQLQGYRVVCLYDRFANVLDFRVARN